MQLSTLFSIGHLKMWSLVQYLSVRLALTTRSVQRRFAGLESMLSRSQCMLSSRQELQYILISRHQPLESIRRVRCLHIHCDIPRFMTGNRKACDMGQGS